MNTTLKKIIKGTLAIFVIKLVIVGGLFVFQSCQSENVNNENTEEAKTGFLSSLKLSNLNLNTLPITNSKNTKNEGFMARDMQGTTETVCLQLFDGSEETITDEILENINTIGQLIDTKTNYNLMTQFDNDDNINNSDSSENNEDTADYDIEDCIALIEIPLQPVVDALEPLVLDAKDYFYSQGFNDNDLNEILEGNDETYLVSLAVATMAGENQDYVFNKNNNVNFLLGIESANATTSMLMNPIAACALQAIGADVIVNLAIYGTKALKKHALKKAIRKIAAKFLGPIGVAIAVVEFGICMATQ
nr:hypothetical protein [uncultured Psychroserpens sp.]